MRISGLGEMLSIHRCNERGTTMVEYALMIALLSVALIGGVSAVSANVADTIAGEKIARGFNGGGNLPTAIPKF